jgi:hypothetical protein
MSQFYDALFPDLRNTLRTNPLRLAPLVSVVSGENHIGARFLE